MNFYNEFEPYPAQWMRNLMGAGIIPMGVVDERSIEQIGADELEGFQQCHFFAGIAGWPEALRLAGWPEGREVWTGSCPCQPFSQAGRGRGVEDDRHLWPVWFQLIKKCRPATIFGEQTSSKAGRAWFSGVRADLEAVGYGVGAADLCAASINAPHRRQRIWWVAYSDGSRRQNRESKIKPDSSGIITQRNSAEGGRDGGVGYSNSNELGGISGCSFGEKEEGYRHGKEDGAGCVVPRPTSPNSGPWDGAKIILCESGKFKRIESGTLPMVDGFSGRVEQIRSYGNAIIPTLAAQFIIAAEEARISL